MSTYTAVVTWEREGAVFSDNRYSREHHLEFDGGSRAGFALRRTSSRADVDPGAVDPEEAFVASLSSCHMLTFLASRPPRLRRRPTATTRSA